MRSKYWNQVKGLVGTGRVVHELWPGEPNGMWPRQMTWFLLLIEILLCFLLYLYDKFYFLLLYYGNDIFATIGLQSVQFFNSANKKQNIYSFNWEFRLFKLYFNRIPFVDKNNVICKFTGRTIVQYGWSEYKGYFDNVYLAVAVCLKICISIS